MPPKSRKTRRPRPTGPSQFGGALAPILTKSMHPSTFFTGSIVGALMAGIGFVAVSAGVSEVIAPLSMAITSMIVVRIAMNSAFGNPDGNLLDTSGGSWAETIRVSGRAIGLNLLWTIPMGLVVGQTMQAFGSMGFDASKLPSGPIVLLILVAGALPPFILIVAVGTSSFGEALSPSTWAQIFAGRRQDLLAMFAILSGGFSAMIVIGAALVVGLGAGNFKFVAFLALVGMAWITGSTLDLFGRLVGGFLRSAGDGVSFEGADFAPGPLDDDTPPTFTTPSPELTTPATPTFDMPSSVPGATAGLDLDQVDQLQDQFPDQATTKPTSLDELFLSVTTKSFDGATPPADLGPDGEAVVSPNDVGSLMERLRANEYIEDDDLYLALEDAELLEQQFGPHPQILGRIAILSRGLERPEALDNARRASEIARKVNNFVVLADLHVAFGAEIDDFGFGLMERQRMAESLSTRGKIDQALSLYAGVLEEVEKPLPIVKALIQLADSRLGSEATAEEALKIYDVLDQSCPNHAFEEFVDRGREVAQRKLHRVES